MHVPNDLVNWYLAVEISVNDHHTVGYCVQSTSRAWLSESAVLAPRKYCTVVLEQNFNTNIPVNQWSALPVLTNPQIELKSPYISR